MTAACAGHPEPLWDATIHGENEVQQHRRHTRALRICQGCPIRQACVAGIDLKHDDGIQGGMVLPTIPDKHRRAWSDWAPGRGGMADLAGDTFRQTPGNVTRKAYSGDCKSPHRKTGRTGALTPATRPLAPPHPMRPEGRYP